MGGDPRLSENVDDLVRLLDGLGEVVKTKSQSLEQTLSQIDVYQQQMQTLRQRIIQEEQQLRLVMAPTYLPHDRERALVEQQVRKAKSLSRVYIYIVDYPVSSCYQASSLESSRNLGDPTLSLSRDLSLSLSLKLYMHLSL